MRILCWELESEEDIRNSFANRLTQNQKLKTPDERNSDGFLIIYDGLKQSEYKVDKLRVAISALKAISE